VVRSRHRLGELPAFSDAALVQLLDELPRELVRAYAPGALGEGSQPPVELGAAPGAAIFETVRNGGLWLDLAVGADPAFRDIEHQLFGELDRVVPDLLPGSADSNLLVSSPGTTVPFRLDTPPGILWHVRGRKRAWVYPALNDALVPRQLLEDLYAGIHRELVDYDTSFDSAALVFELEPGDVISWPQNAPHRIAAIEDVNVSMATEFRTRRSERRARLYRANRFLGRQMHLPVRSTNETGLTAAIKGGVYGAAWLARLTGGGQLPPLAASLRLDAERHSIERLAEPVPAGFS
jgi:hypothetical protein